MFFDYRRILRLFLSVIKDHQLKGMLRGLVSNDVASVRQIRSMMLDIISFC